MSKPEHVPYIAVARRVTRRDGEFFAHVFLARVQETGALGDAFDATNRIEWPDGEEYNAAQARYLAISNEIAQRVADAIRPVLAESFVAAAREVLGRERRRG